MIKFPDLSALNKIPSTFDKKALAKKFETWISIRLTNDSDVEKQKPFTFLKKVHIKKFETTSYLPGLKRVVQDISSITLFKSKTEKTHASKEPAQTE